MQGCIRKKKTMSLYVEVISKNSKKSPTKHFHYLLQHVSALNGRQQAKS
jgi:hypothetical protein